MAAERALGSSVGKGQVPTLGRMLMAHRSRQAANTNPGRLLPLITPICCGIMSVDITLINDITKLMRR